jgi:pimeloyl-ACP methyl ester carboxylesterase
MRTRTSVAAVLGGIVVLVQVSGGALRAQTAPGHSGVRLREETIRIPGPVRDLRLALKHVVSAAPAAGTPRPIVLILLGAVVPVSGNQGYPFGGRSMMQALAEKGLDVWALDYYGLGESDRYPEMREPADRHPPLGTTEERTVQVAAAVEYLKKTHRVERVMLIGLSHGTLQAGLYATRHPESVSRLILFGPVTPFTGGPPPGERLQAHGDYDPRDLWALFTRRSNSTGEAVLDSTMYEAWAATYLRSDSTSGTRNPSSVRMPNGFQADLAAVAAGRYPFDPREVRAPTLIVMGEMDEITTFGGAQWLLKSLRQAPQRRLVVIGRGSHTLQFEAERGQLYRVFLDFLLEARG